MRLVRAAENQGAGCVAGVITVVAQGPACPSAAGLIASTIALDGALSSEMIDGAVASNGPCITTLLAAVGETPDPDAGVVDAVGRWTSLQRDPMARSGGLVVLGSLAHHARERGPSALAAGIDAALAQELRRPVSSKEERIQRLEAAGNAGCAPCSSVVRAAMQHQSSEVRSIAVGALRFVPGEQAPHAMCSALDEDPVVVVRDQAAWALGWGQDDATVRVQCLVRAAARDASGRVRMSAVRSVAALAGDVALARHGLLQLTDPEYDDADVREFALRVVTALPPQAEQTDIVTVR